MKVFFFLRNSGHLRNFESVVGLLAEKGHFVHLGFFKIDELYPEDELARLLRKNPRTTYTVYPKRTWLWFVPAKYIRVLQTYLRFLDKRYQSANKLRQRAASMLPGVVRYFVKMVVGHSESKIWSLVNCLRAIERAIPLDPQIVRVFKSIHPDVFLVTPLIDLSASQLDWVKAARALGIKTGLCVASWDNLSNKSLIQSELEMVIVWNEIQRREAIELHRISAPHIEVTGAQCYDRLFDRQPSTSREDFLQRIGLMQDRPFLLYLCSSRFIAPQEVEFVEEWIKRIRSFEDSRIARLGLLVRPHPQNAVQWRDVDFSHLENVVIYPRQGANPVSGNALDDFFDSMYYSTATIGINTSPMIESGILDKPVFTILSQHFRDTQKGTIHFHHLVNGGLLYIGNSLDEHLEQLAKVINGREFHRERLRNFIQGFVRPHGIELQCTPIFVEAIEKLNREMVLSPDRRSPLSYFLTGLLFPFAVVSYSIKKALTRRTEILRAVPRGPEDIFSL